MLFNKTNAATKSVVLSLESCTKYNIQLAEPFLKYTFSRKWMHIFICTYIFALTLAYFCSHSSTTAQPPFSALLLEAVHTTSQREYCKLPQEFRTIDGACCGKGKHTCTQPSEGSATFSEPQSWILV